jgi:hypothetical protein
MVGNNSKACAGCYVLQREMSQERCKYLEMLGAGRDASSNIFTFRSEIHFNSVYENIIA